MPSTIKLGKVKLVYKGNYNPELSYSKGDIVGFGTVSVGAGTTNNQLFIYKNDTAKSGTYPYVRTCTGITTIGVSTNIIDVAIADLNPGGNFNYTVTPTLSFIYSKYFPSNTKVSSKTTISSNVVRIITTKKSNNQASVSNENIVIGTRRISNRYDTQRNTVDWDLYSESSKFRGDFSSDDKYDMGDIVVKNNQSYVCLSPVSSGNNAIFGSGLGPSTTTKTPDPEFDYVGVWDSFLNSERQDFQRASLLPNTNPYDWKGHPYIEPPRWGNSGIGSYYLGGTPWTLQEDIKNNPNVWRWNNTTTRYCHTYGMNVSFIDEDSNQLSSGGFANDNNLGSNGGGDNDYVSGFFDESCSFSSNSYFDDTSPAYGGLSFSESKNKPKIIQYLRTFRGSIFLFSNGTVGISGSNAGMKGFGADTDTVSNLVKEIKRSSFRDRSIVKLSAHDDARTIANYVTIGALDDSGELWVWGNNGVGQLGVGTEKMNPCDFTIGIDPGSGGGHDYISSQDNTYFSPYCLGDVAFAGKRIVDFAVGCYSMYALDEDGDLWSWGYNNFGQLGYSTNDGFNATDRSRRPRKITTPLGFSWTGSALQSPITFTGTITENIVGASYTKTSGSAAWDAQVYSLTGSAGTIAISAKAGQTNANIMFGLDDDPTVDANYTALAFAWYVTSSGTLGIYENNNSITLDRTYTYTTNTVLSIVYDENDGFVNYYYDLDGDGVYVQLVRRVLKTTRVSSFTTPIYFDSSFNTVGGNLNNINISFSVIPKTWSDYGGIQKFSVSNIENATCWLTVLDGQGYIWNCGTNGLGQLGQEDTTNNNNTSSLRRRKFGTTNISGRINNFWQVGPGFMTIFSVRSNINPNHNETWAVGYNGRFQLTDGSSTNRSTPVIINGPGYRNAVGVTTYIQDIVTVTSGSANGATGQANVSFAIDKNGFIFTFGYDRDGASGAIANGSNGLNICNNQSKMQQVGNTPQAWPRVYLPNTLHGKCIDALSTGDHVVTTYPDVTSSLFLFDNNDILTCGSNVPSSNLGMYLLDGASIRTPISLPGFV
jgi:alpha-tubulin suppressor-like RCC1 family protein